MLKAQIYTNTEQFKNSKPLEHYILELLLSQGIAGATVVRGKAGFGTEKKIMEPDLLFSFDEVPVIITFIDEKEKVTTALKKLREEIKNVLIVTSAVEKFE